jgi:hypothetical protein
MMNTSTHFFLYSKNGSIYCTLSFMSTGDVLQIIDFIKLFSVQQGIMSFMKSEHLPFKFCYSGWMINLLIISV